MKILCRIIGHKLEVTQKLSSDYYRSACKRCGVMYSQSYNNNDKYLWDSRYHRMYEFHRIKIIYKDWEGDSFHNH